MSIGITCNSGLIVTKWAALALARIDLGYGLIPSQFELVDRCSDFLGDGIHRLAAQQTQAHSLLPSSRPALNFGGRAGFSSSCAPRFVWRPQRNPITSFSFSISNSFSPTRIYAKFVSRKIGAGSFQGNHLIGLPHEKRPNRPPLQLFNLVIIRSATRPSAYP